MAVGAVRRADDGDGSGVGQREEQSGHRQREEDAELSGGTEQHQPGLFQQGAEVDHGADADEKQQREQFVGHARVKQGGDGAFGIPLGDGARKGQVDQNGAEPPWAAAGWVPSF